MKGATKVDNLSWLNNLGSELLIQRSLPIHEFDNRSLSSLEAKRELMLAKRLAEARLSKSKKDNKSALISYIKESDKIMVYS